MTKQEAPLERILAYLRFRQVAKKIINKSVIDFGCGVDGWNAIDMDKFGARLVHGVDISLNEAKYKSKNIVLYPSINCLPHNDYQIITAFAVLEHIDPCDIKTILKSLREVTSYDCVMWGTTPSPMSRTLLELLSYRLKLIDQSQIDEHKVYYDDLWIRFILRDTGWYLYSYQKFQFFAILFATKLAVP